MSNRLPKAPNKSTTDRSFYWHLAPLRWLFKGLGLLFPAATARLALRLFRTPRRHRTPGREHRWLETAQRFDLVVDAERLVAWSWGEGPVVLLVHGWEGRGSQMGAFARPLLESGFRVVTFDAPAHGKSAGTQSSLPQFTSAVRAVSAAVGPLHGVVTHSFGAPTTARAARQGLPAKRLVFIAPPADLDEYIDFFCNVLGFSREIRRRMLALMETRLGVDWNEVRCATLSPLAETELLVIHDRSDRDSAFENAETVAAAWPGSELRATDGLGHRRILRHPEVTGLAVDFFARERPAPALSESSAA